MSAARCVITAPARQASKPIILNRPVTEYYPAAIPRSELDPIFPGKVTGCCHDPDELAHWIGANVSGQAPVNRRPASDDLIAYHLQNARQPNAYTEMATAPPPWAKLLNKVSREHAPKKMQKRYIDEVDGLLPLIGQLQM